MKLVRSVPIILVIILALTALDSTRAAAQTDCARTPIEISAITGSWSSASECHSPSRPIDLEGPGDGIYYAVYYDFYVPQTSEVTITLESSTGPYLYLLTGAGRNGEELAQSDDIDYDADNLNSRIIETLEPGDYSIEATTYAREATGEFTLTVEGINFAAQRDRAALIALYNATNGDNWTNNDNWLNDAPLNEWHGVTTDSDGRVTELDLRHNRLIGDIPSEVTNLTGLEHLGLDLNALEGQIPSTLGNLTNLKELHLDFNRLEGTVPSTLGDLTNLTSLYLSSNLLTGTIPSELGNLTNLEELSLEYNRLWGELPRNLTALTHLRWFAFSDNAGLCAPDDEAFRKWLQSVTDEPDSYTCVPLSTTPDARDMAVLTVLYDVTDGDNWTDNTNWFSEQPLQYWKGVTINSDGRVIILDLDINNLSGHIPTELGDLDALEKLVLGGQLAGAIPPELGNLIRLELLDLSNNELTGAIPLELSSLTNMKDLRLYNNRLTGHIPPELGNLSTLDSLRLDGNQLAGTIPSELAKLINLIRLNLSENELTGFIPPELSDLTALMNLSLDDNQLTGEIPSGLGNLHRLRWLLLDHNQLTGQIPPEIGNLTDLRYVRFAGNQLAGCVPAALRDVNHNDFDEIGLPFCEEAQQSPDRAALTALYNATDGANWTRNDNWLTDAPLDDWYGVDTDSKGRVTELVLEGNELTGAIPSEIGNLINLTSLKLEGNKFTGTIPPELGNLTNLLTLEFDANNLTGSIPPELGNIAELEVLHLAGNDLSGSIPSELGNLSNLLSMGLSRNQLTGTIPSEFGSLSSLERLYLDNNQLTGVIPPELGNLNLILLSLNSNNLTGEIPPELGNLTNLRWLNLADNQFTGCIPHTLRNVEYNDFAELGLPFCESPDRAALVALYHATDGDNWRNNTDWLSDAPLDEWHGVTTDANGRVIRLELTYNELRGEIPSELTTLANLTALDINGNDLTGKIPAEFVNLTNLEMLDIGANELSGDIPPELSDLAKLTSLNLHFNSLTGAIPPELGNLANLKILDLRVNELTGEIPSELGNLANLTSLRLGFNELSGEIPLALTNLVNLTELRLGDNALTGEIPPELARLANLRELELRYNELTGEIPPEFGKLSRLKGLALHVNNLTGKIPSELGNLPNLERIRLRNNNLTGEIPPELSNLTNLRNIGLGINDLTGEIPPELGNLTNLRSIRLGNNDLTGEIPSELGNLTNLEELELDDNNLMGEIPSELGNLTNLEEIWINHNRLTGMLPHSFTELTELHEFYFDHNAGLCAPADAPFQEWLANIYEFRGNTCGIQPPTSNDHEIAALTALYNATDGDNWRRNTNWLSNEPLGEWYGVFTDDDGQVVEILLWANNLSGQLPPELGNLSNLEFLYLDDNELDGTLPRGLGNIASLRILSLSGNLLLGELPQDLPNLTALKSLYFDNNAGLCAPADAAFQEWLQSINNVRGDNCETTPPPPAPSECSEHISDFAAYERTLTSDCTSEKRTAFGDHYARQFTFTLAYPTTVEVVIRSQHIDTHIFVTDDDGETIVDIDDYIGRNAGFRKALQPGDYTIEVTTFRSTQTGDFTITFGRPEFDALKALYESAGGAGWARQDNWLSDAPLSEWQGVQTDSEGRVTQVNLIANNLTGEIPSELQDLTHLEGLYLGRNELSGTIPGELGSLPALQVLLLSDNELTGRIPAQLGNLANLRELYLSRNQLSGSIPATLGRLENLHRLHMAANELSGGIPRDLGNLTNLRHLSMSDNSLTGSIPSQLANLDKLTHIYLWGNELTSGSFFLHLGDMDSLQFIDIGGNRIAGSQMLPESEELDNLTGLGLHDTDLTDGDLLDYMGDLQALDLEFLNLRSNDLSDPQILVGLSRITTLQRLAINDNNFSGQLPRSMTELTLMRIFHFDDNKGLCAPADAEFQNWLTGIRDFRGDTCGVARPMGAPAPASHDAKVFGAERYSSHDAISETHNLSLLESIQPRG